VQFFNDQGKAFNGLASLQKRHFLQDMMKKVASEIFQFEATFLLST